MSASARILTQTTAAAASMHASGVRKWQQRGVCVGWQQRWHLRLDSRMPWASRYRLGRHHSWCAADSILTISPFVLALLQARHATTAGVKTCASWGPTRRYSRAPLCRSDRAPEDLLGPLCLQKGHRHTAPVSLLHAAAHCQSRPRWHCIGSTLLSSNF
jgi:hypothetical protein